MDYYLQARRLLRNEMKRRGITISELSVRLQEMGDQEAVRSLTTKITRGRFQLSFFIQCMAAMGVETATLRFPTRAEIRGYAVPADPEEQTSDPKTLNAGANQQIDSVPATAITHKATASAESN